MLSDSDISRKFDYVPGTKERQRLHHNVRTYCKDLAQKLNIVVPDGPEKNLMFEHLELVMMWANKGVANAERGTED